MTEAVSLIDPLAWLMTDRLKKLNQLKLSKISAGEDVIDLSMINPDIEPPRYLLDRLVESSLHLDRHRYAVSRGIRKLREAFAYKYSKKFNVHINAEREICATMGSKDGLLHCLTCLNKGLELRALVGAPTYSAYISALNLGNYQYDFFHISGNEAAMLREIDEKTRAKHYTVVLLNFPNNPTGVAVSAEFYQELHKLASERGFFVVNDFVYGEMMFDRTSAVSLLEGDPAFEHSAEIYSLSKAYSVPGWRVAAVLGNQDLVKRLSALKAHIDYGIFLPTQDAAAIALTTSGLSDGIVDHYRRRCRTLVKGLRSLGWEIHMPAAGAFVWAKAPIDGDELVYDLLSQYGVMLLPGSCFGDEYKNYVRFALVADEEKLQRVIDSLALAERKNDYAVANL